MLKNPCQAACLAHRSGQAIRYRRSGAGPSSLLFPVPVPWANGRIPAAARQREFPAGGLSGHRPGSGRRSAILHNRVRGMIRNRRHRSSSTPALALIPCPMRSISRLTLLPTRVRHRPEFGHTPGKPGGRHQRTVEGSVPALKCQTRRMRPGPRIATRPHRVRKRIRRPAKDAATRKSAISARRDLLRPQGERCVGMSLRGNSTGGSDDSCR